MARISFLVSLSTGVGLFIAGAAFGAGSTSVGGYGGTAGQTQAAIHQGVLGNTNGTLPFTGMNLTLIAAAGVVLLLTGIVLRRRSNRPNG